MANDHDLEKGEISPKDEKTSSSSSDGSTGSDSTDSTSPPSTPPSPDERPQDPPQYEEEEPEPIPRLQHAPHSSNPPRRGRRGAHRMGPSTRLGAIDEHSNTVAPDIPTRNPNRLNLAVKYNSAAKFLGLGAWAHAKGDADKDVPAPDVYDKIVGPRGEKFADVRRNQSHTPPPRSRRKWPWIVVVALVVVLIIGLGAGLGVGLANKKSSVSVDSDNEGSDSSANDPKPFPIGSYSMPTYLETTVTNCTATAATWLCYPYSDYSASSPSNSFSTLLWQITSPTNSTLDLQISNANPTFSYPFTNQTLRLSDANDVRLSAFTFTFPFRKQVIPNADITGDNTATRCYYNNTILSVRLYNNAEGAGGNVVGPPAGTPSADTMDWPYAIEYEERIGDGPECYRYVNGQETTPVEVAAGSGGDCVCGYRNYGLN